MTMHERVKESYTLRGCFVCGLNAPCGHREFNVEKAIILAQIEPIAKPKPIKKAAPFMVSKDRKQGSA